MIHQLLFYFYVKIFSEELGAVWTTVSVKNCIVSCGNIFLDPEVLNTGIRIFHIGSLTYITDDPCVEALNLELECADSEGMTRPQTIAFIIE